MDEDFVSVSKAARIKGVTRDTIYKAIERQKLKGYTQEVVVKQTFVKLSELAEWKPATYGGVERAKVPRGRSAKAETEQEEPT